MVSRQAIIARTPTGDPAACVRHTDPERLAAVLEDAAHVPGGHTPVLAVPSSEAAVAALLRGSHAVLPVGAQSSLTGGATPRGEVVLSTSGFTRLEPCGPDRIRVGAGVPLSRVDEFLAERGGFYPPAPTYLGATLGGTIATNAAGAATFKHGTTRAWVDALTVVLPEGDVLDLVRGTTFADADNGFTLELSRGVVRVPIPTLRMPATPKLSAGYFSAPRMDIVDLFVGAEGTLGVIVEATVRFAPVRPSACLALVTLRERDAAIALVGALREAARTTWRSGDTDGIDVSAIEHMDRRSLALLHEDGVMRRLGVTLDPGADMALLVTLDLPPGTSADAVYDALGRAAAGTGRGPVGRFAALLEAHGALEQTIIAPPGDAAAAARLLALREAVPVAVNQRIGRAQRDVDGRIDKTAADVVVPFEQFGSLLARCERLCAEAGLDLAVWGHISDGNVHPNIIPTSVRQLELGREAVLAFGREAVRLGGAPLAEHGVGRNPTKQRLLQEMYGAAGIDQMRRVKSALDPRWVLAPGVLFPRP